MENYSSLEEDLARIRSLRPLVHNITNLVVMNNTANALLALGASPVMAHAREEVSDMARIAGALVINVGTLSPGWVDAMELAMGAATAAGVPIVYDPVGAGATEYRNDVNRRLLRAVTPTIVRGNGSEIMAVARGFGLSFSSSAASSSVSSAPLALSPLSSSAAVSSVSSAPLSSSAAAARTKGVDSLAASAAAVGAATALSEYLGCVVVVSGAVDYIVSGSVVRENHRGTPMMERVTGMGCTATAICGAFAAVNGDAAQAALHAMELMGACGEGALAHSTGPGSFQVAFLDEVYGFVPTLMG